MVVDADTVASPALLTAFAARVHAGAHGGMPRDLPGGPPAASWSTCSADALFSWAGHAAVA